MNRLVLNMEEGDSYPLKLREITTSAKNGCVYVVEDTERKLCKIGCSVNPASRTRAIQTTSGIGRERIHISKPISNFRHCETMVHRVLQAKRNVGEWFECAFDEAVAVVNSVVAQEGNFKTPEPVTYLVPDGIQEDCTDWFCSDTPELARYLRRNGFLIAWCSKRKAFVVRTRCPEEEFEEMEFGLFAAITLSQVNKAECSLFLK